MRVALAGVLFLEPDLLLLDEPTNHLDLEAAIWLEEHLRRYPRTLILVSHDRDFLNSVPEKTCHLEGSKLTLYAGGYDQFERTRRERLVLAEKARERQAAERAHIQSFVDRFRYKASKARQAQSRIKMLERMEPIAQALIEPEIRFSFPAGSVPAPPMITMDGARAGYGDKVVLSGLSLRLDPDDRIALLGRNGNGKSHLRQAGRRPAGADGGRAGPGARAEGRLLRPAPDRGPRARGDPAPAHPAPPPEQREQQTRAWLARFGLGQDQAAHQGAPPLGRREDPARLGADVPRRAAAADPRRADQPSRHRQPRGAGRGGQRVPRCGHRHQPRPAPGRAGRRFPVAGRGRQVRPYDGDMDDYRRLLLETSAEPTAPRRAKPDRRPAGERRALLAPCASGRRRPSATIERLDQERAGLEARLADPASYGNGADIGALQKRLAELGR